MFLVLSHILSFVVLLVNSIYDVFNNHDVPDVPGLIGIVGGLGLHGVYSLSSAGLGAITWSIGVGVISQYTDGVHTGEVCGEEQTQ